MINGIYPLLSGGLAIEKAMDTVTNNLANISTTGYKRDSANFKTFLPPPDPEVPVEENVKYGSFVTLNSVITDFSAGALKNTGNELDMAIEGDAFFAVQLSDGSTGYTRAGDFSINPEGELITKEGYQVLGENGAIVFNPEENIVVDGTGGLFSGQEEVGRLKLVTFNDKNKLEKLNDRLFKETPASGEELEAENISIVQGSLESSNVNPVKELVDMIKVARTYESLQRLTRGLDETGSKGINELGRI